MISFNEMLDISNLVKKTEKKERIQTLDKALDEINNANSIVILTHESPDGDAIGSSMAMKHILDYLGKNADVIMSEYSRMYNFLPKINEIKKESEIKHYDLAISVDCADIKRLDNREYFENAKKTIVLDHHGSNKMYGDLNFVNPVSPACCDVLSGLIKYFDIKISKDLGTCLLTGIITDTGGFSHNGTNAETFEFTSDLIRLGVNVPDIYKRTLKTKTKANFELTKRIIDRMEFLENNRVTFTYMTRKDEEETCAEPGDHEGLVEIGREIENVKLSIFLRQRDNSDTYKVSMRSEKDINVSDICLMFGGGGHPQAAGCLVQGSIEEVKSKIMKEVRKWME